MENKAHAIAAGVFVLLLSATLVALAVWLTRETGSWLKYEIATSGSVSGLQSQASVRYRGVKVGKVSDIRFDAHKPGQILVQLEVEEATPITRSTYATIGFLGLTGISFIQLDDSGDSAERLVPADGRVPRIPMQLGLMDRLAEQGSKILAELEQGSSRFNQLLGPENQQALRTSMQALGEAAAAVPPAMRQAGASFESMRDAAASVSASADRVRKAADDYARLALRVQQPGGTLDQLQQGVEGLALTGQALEQGSLPRLNSALDDTGRAVRKIGRVATKLDDNPQALIYGPSRDRPGPGEAGFVVPGGAR